MLKKTLSNDSIKNYNCVTVLLIARLYLKRVTKYSVLGLIYIQHIGYVLTYTVTVRYNIFSNIVKSFLYSQLYWLVVKTERNPVYCHSYFLKWKKFLLKISLFQEINYCLDFVIIKYLYYFIFIYIFMLKWKLFLFTYNQNIKFLIKLNCFLCNMIVMR